jgi:hypothetical protein
MLSLIDTPPGTASDTAQRLGHMRQCPQWLTERPLIRFCRQCGLDNTSRSRNRTSGLAWSARGILFSLPIDAWALEEFESTDDGLWEAPARAAERLVVLPPFAPAAETWARTTVESNIWTKCAVSLIAANASKNASKTPVWLSRQNRFQTLFQLPNSAGSARQVRFPPPWSISSKRWPMTVKIDGTEPNVFPAAESEPPGMERFEVPPEIQQMLAAVFSGEKTSDW